MSDRTIGFARSRATIAALLAFSVFLAGGCGGGGDSASSGNVPGAATVGISVASAPAAGTVFAASTTAAEGSAAPSAPAFDNILVTIVKVALVPGDGDGGPDLNGEPLVEDNGPSAGGHVVFVLPTPRVIDLLHLPPPESAGELLAGIPDVPPGTYGKIRLFYSNLEGVRGGTVIPFHPTANSHFDVHFVDGALVVPVPTGSEGAVTFFAVQIRFVGLKIVENNNNVLMRPQVFAVVEDLLFRVAGTAQNVDKGAQRFDIVPAVGEGSPVPAVYNGTIWAFRDGPTQVAVAPSLGVAALDNGAVVEAIGSFGAGGVFAAERVFITFPAVVTGLVVSGDAASGWKPDNTFEVLPGGATDNVIVFPRPTRADARYDNTADPSTELSDDAIVNGADVTARGYAVTGGVDAFWISVAP